MKDNIPGKNDIVGFLGKATEVEGKINFRGTLRVDGKFKGNIYSESLLVVGETAQIDGEIDVSQASISGKVTGIIRASDKVELFAKAKVFAEISTSCLKIEEGAVFQGNCSMESKKSTTSPMKKSLDLSLLAKKEK